MNSKNKISKYGLGIEGELINIKDQPLINIGVVGCGSHAFRNIYPCFQFLPVNLVAVCDLNEEKAKLFKRHFGAENYYTDYTKMAENEKLDAVFLILGFSKNGCPQYPLVANYFLKKRIPIWMEKPPAENSLKVKEMINNANEGKTFVQVGFKKMFMPSIRKIVETINNKEFGRITTYSIRYPLDLPKDIRAIETAPARRFLDDFVHIASTILVLIGKPKELFYKRSFNGGGIAIFIHDKGVIGSIHFSKGASEMTPLEFLEIVGEETNVILKNNIEIIYYPPSKRLPYGRTTSFLPNNPSGAHCFIPEFSLGQLYNKSLFLLGYYHELEHFVTSVIKNVLPRYASLKDALDIMEIYDAFAGEEEKIIKIGNSGIRYKRRPFIQRKTPSRQFLCPNCKSKLVLKDGWNYNCKKCGRMVASSELK